MTDASAGAVKGGRGSKVAKGEDVEMADGTEHQQQDIAPECPNLNDLNGDSRFVVYIASLHLQGGPRIASDVSPRTFLTCTHFLLLSSGIWSCQSWPIHGKKILIWAACCGPYISSFMNHYCLGCLWRIHPLSTFNPWIRNRILLVSYTNMT